MILKEVNANKHQASGHKINPFFPEVSKAFLMQQGSKFNGNIDQLFYWLTKNTGIRKSIFQLIFAKDFFRLGMTVRKN